jgi:DNA-binding beta-propeller fold protein YncE
MMRTNGGLYFFVLNIKNDLIQSAMDDESFFREEWVKSAVETDPDKILACIMGDDNIYVIDRTLNLVMRSIQNVALSLSSLVMTSYPQFPNYVTIRDKNNLSVLNLLDDKVYKLIDIPCDPTKDFQ